uniref:Pseudouridine-5'-phosphatase n=1 Tax=Dendroctonus ponderosae TaxID=77166 RepID=J3JYD2_DENPD|nr:unknown [Dendroctonus ponderosae]
MTFAKVTHVIFDLDGLMLDTERIYQQVLHFIAAKHDAKYTLETKLKIQGTTEIYTAETVIADMNLPYTPEEFLEVYWQLATEPVKHAKLMPGVTKLVRHLHEHKIPICIATSCGRAAHEVKTQDYRKLMSLFSHVVCGPEVKHGKPAPDIFLMAAAKFDDAPQPKDCLVFEDAPNGARGAVAAGMQVVLVPDPDVPEKWRKPATLVLNSLEEFQPEAFGLPRYDD